MALLGYEGFDYFTATPQTDLATLPPFDKTGSNNAFWNALIFTGGDMNKSPGLLGGSCIACTNLNSPLPRVTFRSNYSTFIAGFRWRPAGGNLASLDIIRFADITTGTAVIQCGLSVNGTTGRLFFWRGTSATVLATGTTTIVAGSWYFIEIKVTINGTTGSVLMRLAGTGTEISASGLNTQTSANAYLNQVIVVPNPVSNPAGQLYHSIDDLYCEDTTGPAPFNDFLGVIRIETLFPTNIVSVTWTPKDAFLLPWASQQQAPTYTLNTLYLEPWTPTGGGVLSKIQAQWQASFTGNIKAALYDSSGPGGEPGNLIDSTSAVTNPVGNVTVGSAAFYDFPFGSPPTVVANTKYWIAWLADTSNIMWSSNAPPSGFTYATTYGGGFPASLTPGSLVSHAQAPNTPTFWTGINAVEVQEVNMDSNTSYNSELSTGIDLYGHSALQSTPVVIYGMAVVSAAEKTDVLNMNYRNKMISGAVTSDGATTNLATIYQYTRDDYPVDPNTGVAWVAADVNATDFGYERY